MTGDLPATRRPEAGGLYPLKGICRLSFKGDTPLDAKAAAWTHRPPREREADEGFALCLPLPWPPRPARLPLCGWRPDPLVALSVASLWALPGSPPSPRFGPFVGLPCEVGLFFFCIHLSHGCTCPLSSENTYVVRTVSCIARTIGRSVRTITVNRADYVLPCADKSFRCAEFALYSAD